MNDTSLPPSPLDRAIKLAVDAHRGQVDKADAPYILHPLRVMLAQRDDNCRIAAILHDVVEDCGISAEAIRDEFGEAIANAVIALSRQTGEDYDAFVVRCAADPIARHVKRADIVDNMDLSRLPRVTEADHDRVEKYRRALSRLDAIGVPTRP